MTDPALTSVKGTLEYQVCQEGQCVMFDEEFTIPLKGAGNVVEKTAEVPSGDLQASDTQKDESLWMFFWLAFVAGLAAVVMPCVFP